MQITRQKGMTKRDYDELGNEDKDGNEDENRGQEGEQRVLQLCIK